MAAHDYGFGVSEDAPLGERVRAAEVVAVLCLATDLGMALPFEHGLHQTLIAMRLGERLGIDAETASDTYYASLLAHSGCTTEAWMTADVFGGSLTTNVGPVVFGSPRQQFAATVATLPTPGSTLAGLVLAVWGALERNPFFAAMTMALVEHGTLSPSDPSAPDIFAVAHSLADAQGTGALLEAAGFSAVHTEEVPVCFPIRDAEEYVAITADTAGPIGLALQALDETECRALAEKLRRSIVRFARGDGYEVPGIAVCAVAG